MTAKTRVVDALVDAVDTHFDVLDHVAETGDVVGAEPLIRKAHQSMTKLRLTLEQIDAIDDRPEIEVEVPEWNGTVAIRALSPTQISLARAKAWNVRTKETDEGVLNAWCLEMGVIDPKPTFSKATSWLNDKSFGSVNTILAELMRASGLGAKAEDAAKSEPGAEPGS